MVLEASKRTPHIVSFFDSLTVIVNEVNKLKQSSETEAPLSAESSLVKGIQVSDLIAAHTSKRAWACSGSSFSCNNGEVLVVLGDAASGKSRLLTAIAESSLTPPRRSRSTTQARGLVSIDGVDVTMWNEVQLKRKVGVLLNDIRTLADTAQLYSGLSLETILDPLDTKDVSMTCSHADN